MSDALNPTVPAGWYPDPWGSESQRWWDGSVWTDNLYPQPEPEFAAPSAEDAPVEAYQPAAVRSTYEPASASAYPSRRALREASPASDTAVAAGDAPAAEQAPAEAPAPSDPLPTFAQAPGLTQAPEFSPEPASVLPPPVWTEPDPPAQPAEAAHPVEAVSAASPAAAEAAPAPAAEAMPAPAAEAVPAPAAETPAPATTAEPATAEPATVDTDTDDGWAASLARWDDVDTTSAPPDTMPIFGDAPPVSYSQRAMRYQPLHGRTSAVWLMVFIPLLDGASIIGSMYLFPGLFRLDAQFGLMVSIADPMTTLLALRDWLLLAALPLTLAFFVFTLVLGFQDRSRLRLLGHDQTASPWWIVLNPLVYLIVRSVRVRQCTGRRGSGPLTTYICLYIAPPLAIIVAQTVITSLYGAIPV